MLFTKFSNLLHNSLAQFICLLETWWDSFNTTTHLCIISSKIPKNYRFLEPKTWMYLIMRFITVYDKAEAIIEEIVADSTAEYPNFKSWIIRMNLVILLTTSKIELAKSIFIKIFFNFWKFNFPVNFFVYFCLLSKWNRITKIVL